MVDGGARLPDARLRRTDRLFRSEGLRSADDAGAGYFFPPSRPIAAMCSRFWLTTIPPLRPASRASSGVNSCAVPFAWAALPPLLAISRCFSLSIDANPRRLVPLLCCCVCVPVSGFIGLFLSVVGPKYDSISHL